MEISLTTPALLFPAISLLMLAYANLRCAQSVVLCREYVRSLCGLDRGWLVEFCHRADPDDLFHADFLARISNLCRCTGSPSDRTRERRKEMRFKLFWSEPSN